MILVLLFKEINFQQIFSQPYFCLHPFYQKKVKNGIKNIHAD